MERHQKRLSLLTVVSCRNPLPVTQENLDAVKKKNEEEANLISLLGLLIADVKIYLFPLKIIH